MISRQTEKNVLGPNPEVVAPLRVSKRWIPKKKNFSSTSRCSFQQRMVFVTVSMFCSLNCRVTVAFQQSCVLFCLSFAIRGATSGTIVSIPLLPLPAAVWLLTTCRWWRTIKAASCQWHVLCRWELNRLVHVKYAKSVSTPAEVELKGRDIREQGILERLRTWTSFRRRPSQSYIDCTIIMSTIQSCQIRRGLRARLVGQRLWMAPVRTIYKWSL